MSNIGTAELSRWLMAFSDLVEQNIDELTRLDSAIGDADHGVNMQRGASAIRATLDSAALTNPDEFFNAVGEAILEGIGGAAGPLYASLFLGMASACEDQESLDTSSLCTALSAGVESLSKRGRADVGDKTMYDAAHPAVQAMSAAADQGIALDRLIRTGQEQARAGRLATEPLQARKGRASYLGPRSVGHIDPGAASVTLLFEAMSALLEETA